jgi:lipooligosaccharide transport system ATP-binding protein
MPAAVTVQNVSKTYHPARGPPVRAIEELNLEIPQGTLFGFLGPNGAGKTTLMEMIRAHMEPTHGHLSVLGHALPRHARRLKARLGVVPQEDNLDPDFTVLRNLTLYAGYFGIPRRTAEQRAHVLLEFVGLTEKKDSAISSLSGGMKRRLALARGLINEPDMLVLDEPTTGLDPQARHLVWEKIRQLKRRGLTILLTTHYMDEAERLCDDLVIIDAGRILAQGAPQELIRRHAGAHVLEITQEEAPKPERPDWLTPDERSEAVGDRLLIYTPDPDDATRRVRQHLNPQAILARRAGLEDVFLHLTGRDLRE